MSTLSEQPETQPVAQASPVIRKSTRTKKPTDVSASNTGEEISNAEEKFKKEIEIAADESSSEDSNGSSDDSSDDSSDEDWDDVEHPKKSARKISYSDIIKQLVTRPKLNMDNWHQWNQAFRMLVETKYSSLKYLNGDIKKGHRRYDKTVDKSLTQVIITGCDVEGIRGVGHIIMRGPDDGTWNALELYKALETELTIHDKYIKGKIQTDLPTLTIKGTDVKRYIKEVDALVARALAVGTLIGESQKMSLLIGAASKIYSFERTIHSLKVTGNLTTYRSVAEALISDQDDIEARIQCRPTGPQHARAATETQHSEGYWKGKRDPRFPDRPAVCYNCGKTGHISKMCKSPRSFTKRAIEMTEETAEP